MAQIINLNDSAPAAPANSVNGKWQKGATTGVDPSTGLPIYPASVYLSAATLSTLGLVKPDGVGIGIDASGKISLIGTSLTYKGAWSGSTLYSVGDIATYSGEAYLCIEAVDESIVPALVQAAAAGVNGTGSVAFPSNVTAGDLLIVLTTLNSAAVTPTDTLGTVYTLVDSSGGAGFFGNVTAMHWGVAPASGANTVSFAGTSLSGIAVAEFRGVTSLVDTHAANFNVASLSLTTAHPTMIVIGRAEHSGNTDTYTGTGGVTIAVQRSDATRGTMALGYLAEGSAGTYTPGISGTSDHNQVVVAGAFLDGAVSPDVDTEHWLALGTVEPTGPANQVVATPNGSSGQAALRALDAADLPVMVGDSGSGGTKGAVPAPPAGAAAAGKFLKADGTFAVPAGGSGTVTSVALTVPNGMSVTGSPVTASGTLAISAVYQLGCFLAGMPAASQMVGVWAFLYAWTLPANAAGSSGKCGTNPTSSATYNIKKNGSTVGTVAISTGGVFTFATTGGTSVSFAAGDTLTLVAPSSPDATLSDVQVIFLANR
jgi:hypothetical protein